MNDQGSTLLGAVFFFCDHGPSSELFGIYSDSDDQVQRILIRTFTAHFIRGILSADQQTTG